MHKIFYNPLGEFHQIYNFCAFGTKMNWLYFESLKRVMSWPDIMTKKGGGMHMDGCWSNSIKTDIKIVSFKWMIKAVTQSERVTFAGQKPLCIYPTEVSLEALSATNAFQISWQSIHIGKTGGQKTAIWARKQLMPATDGCRQQWHWIAWMRCIEIRTR